MINTLLPMVFKTFLSTIFDGRLKLAKLATKTDIATVNDISRKTYIFMQDISTISCKTLIKKSLQMKEIT